MNRYARALLYVCLLGCKHARATDDRTMASSGPPRPRAMVLEVSHRDPADLTGAYLAGSESRTLGTCDPAFFTATPVAQVEVRPGETPRIYTRLDTAATGGTPVPHILAVEQPDGTFLCASSGTTGAEVFATAPGTHAIWIGASSPAWSGRFRARAFVSGADTSCGAADQTPEEPREERRALHGYRRRTTIDGMFEDLVADGGAYPATVDVSRGCYIAVFRAGEDAILPAYVDLRAQMGDGSGDRTDDGYRHGAWEGNASGCFSRAPRISFCVAHDATMTFWGIGHSATASGPYTLEIWAGRYVDHAMHYYQEPAACGDCRTRIRCVTHSPVSDACRERYELCYRAAGASHCYDTPPTHY